MYADAAIDPPALASKTCRLKATAKPLGFALVGVPAKTSLKAMRRSLDPDGRPEESAIEPTPV
jgi:hypothetical protein